MQAKLTKIYLCYRKVNRLGLDFNTPVGDNKVGGKVEVDFASSDSAKSENLRIRHAYLTFNDWLVWLSDIELLASDHAPEMIDISSSNIGGSRWYCTYTTSTL